MTEKEIRKQISDLLAKGKPNYSEILFLSNELAKFDRDNIRFSVDAGVIDRLGSELVARQETAVSELVKNAYDADATEVTLTFVESSQLGGTLIISDDGLGMDREQLINGFMRISSSDKIHNPYSVMYHRKRAGQKGIGRFAVQRLGSKLTIITQTEESDDSLQLTINWDTYSNDKELYNITNSLEVIPKKQNQGTILQIDNLRDKWTEAAIKRIYRYVGDILQPFPLSTQPIAEVENGSIKIDPGFRTTFYISPKDKIKKKVVDEKTMIYDHALAVINGEIDNEGFGRFNTISEKLDLEYCENIGLDPDDHMSRFDKIKNVKFKAYYYIYGIDMIPKLHETSIRKLASTSGGIRLYRNGFRVLPYGEANNDWLGLDASTRRRSILPVHTNINFFGFVEISDTSGDFEETSSREGLMANESLVQLQNFIYRTIISSVIRIAEHRNVKIVSGQQKDEDGNWERMEVRIKNIAHTLEELDKALEEQDNSVIAKKQRKKRVKTLKQDLKEVSKIQKEERANLLKERSMLRVLSSVGLTIG